MSRQRHKFWIAMLSILLVFGMGLTASAGAQNNESYLFYQAQPYLLAQQDTEETIINTGDLEASAGIPEETDNDGYTDEEIAEMINNPLGNLWLMFMQNDTTWVSGDAMDALNESDKVFNTFMLCPVMPMQLTKDLKYIFRPVIPIHSFDLPTSFSFDPSPDGNPTPSAEFDRETGLGDIVLWNAFSTNEGSKPPNIMGFGFTAMLDTATDEQLGTGKWSAGPMGLVFRITDKWILGTVYQHWWSFAGDSDRDHVNLSDLQYIIRYRITPETNIGVSPNIRYDWSREDSDDRLTLPVGMGVDTLIKLGPLPVKIGAEVYYYVAKPDSIGPEWQVRLYFTPVLPSPSWSKKPIF